MRYLLSLLLVYLPLSGFAQKVVYTYDDCGNRTSRQVVFVQLMRKSTSQKQEEFSVNSTLSSLCITYTGNSAFSGEYSYSLYDRYGELLLSGTSPNTSCQVNINLVPKKLYILKINYLNENHSYKIVHK